MMRHLQQRSVSPRGMSILLGAFLLITAAMWVVFSMPRAQAADKASGERLITIHDRGTEKVVLTKAATVEQALSAAKVTLDDSDRVEPRLSLPLEAASYTVNIYRARPVIVVDGALRQKVMTAHQTANAIAAEAGLLLHDEDKTTLRPNDDIVADGAGQMMVVARATEFTLELYGKKTTAYTQEKTVGDMIKRKKITLGKDDTLSVPATTPMTAGMTVAIWRNGVQTLTQEEDVTFGTRQVQAPDQPVGYKQVQTPGQSGKKMVTYQIDMRNGTEVSRAAIQSVVTKQPVEQVEVVGTKPSFSGDFAAALAKLRSCESGGNYANKKNSSYRGAYQFGYGTWGNKFGIYDPADASPSQQDQAARELYVRRGWQPWPHCGANLPDTYR